LPPTSPLHLSRKPLYTPPIQAGIVAVEDRSEPHTIRLQPEHMGYPVQLHRVGRALAFVAALGVPAGRASIRG